MKYLTIPAIVALSACSPALQAVGVPEGAADTAGKAVRTVCTLNEAGVAGSKFPAAWREILKEACIVEQIGTDVFGIAGRITPASVAAACTLTKPDAEGLNPYIDGEYLGAWQSVCGPVS